MQRFHQADMHHEIMELEVIYQFAHGCLEDLYEGMKRKIHTLPSNPES
jgi:hypothetical protein